MPGSRSVEKKCKSGHRRINPFQPAQQFGGWLKGAVEKRKCDIKFLARDCLVARWHLLQVLCCSVNPNQDLFILSAEDEVDKSETLSFFLWATDTEHQLLHLYVWGAAAGSISCICLLSGILNTHSTHFAALQTLFQTLSFLIHEPHHSVAVYLSIYYLYVEMGKKWIKWCKNAVKG